MQKVQTVPQIPFKGNIIDAAFYLQKMNGGKLENYFQAFLLKWTIEKKILIIEEEKEFLTKKEHGSIFLLEEEKSAEETIEAIFWNILLDASDEENKITDHQIKIMAKADAILFTSLSKKLTNDSKDYLTQNGYLEEKERKFFYFNMKRSQKSTGKGEELYNQLVQYFHYLEDLIKYGGKSKNESISGKDTFIWISLFGLADKLYSQTKKMSSQQLKVQMGVPYQVIEVYTKLAPFLDSFSIGFTYAKNSVNRKQSCC